VKQAKLLAPFAESHFCFDPKTRSMVRCSSASRASFLSGRGRRIGEESLHYHEGSRVGGMRQLERNELAASNLINRISIMRRCRGRLFVRLKIGRAWRISSFRSEETFITEHFAGSARRASTKIKRGMETGPNGDGVRRFGNPTGGAQHDRCLRGADGSSRHG